MIEKTLVLRRRHLSHFQNQVRFSNNTLEKYGTIKSEDIQAEHRR